MSYVNGKGFFFDSPTGSYVGDIKYVIDDKSVVPTNIDMVNYTLKNLFDYVKSSGESGTNTDIDTNTKKKTETLKKQRDINSFFVANKTPHVFTQKLYTRPEGDGIPKKEENKKLGGKKGSRLSRKHR